MWYLMNMKHAYFFAYWVKKYCVIDLIQIILLRSICIVCFHHSLCILLASFLCLDHVMRKGNLTRVFFFRSDRRCHYVCLSVASIFIFLAKNFWQTLSILQADFKYGVITLSFSCLRIVLLALTGALGDKMSVQSVSSNLLAINQSFS